MKKSSANVSKEATGFAFFVLLDSDNLIESNDPCHCFVPIDEVADPDTLDTFIEVYSKEIEGVEEFEDSVVLDSDNKNWEFIDFEEVEFSCSEGRISVASIDPESGLIFLQREKPTPSEGKSATYEKVVIPKKLPLIYDDEELSNKEYDAMFFEHKMYCQSLRPQRHHRERYRDNLKTMPESKVQRSNRGLLAQVKNRYIADEEFFDVATLLSNQLVDFIMSSDEEFEFSA